MNLSETVETTTCPSLREMANSDARRKKNRKKVKKGQGHRAQVQQQVETLAKKTVLK